MILLKVRVGDKVLSYDIKKQKFIITPVLYLKHPIREGVYSINNGLLRPTDDHPLYVEKPDGRRGWAAINPTKSKVMYANRNAMPLEIGDRLFMSNGKWITIKSISFQPGPIHTYTFAVDSPVHDYFANGFLVSNVALLSCCIDSDCPDDGYVWKDTGNTRWVSDGVVPTTPTDITNIPGTYKFGDTISVNGSGSNSTENEQKEQREYYDDWYCDSGSCAVSETATSNYRWVDTGTTRAAAVTYYYKIENVNDGKILKDWGTSNNTYTIQLADAHDTIKVYVKAEDADGFSAVYNESFVVANSNPVISNLASSSTTINATESITFSATASDPENDPLTLKWYILNTTGAIIKTYTDVSSITNQFNVSGVYQVKFSVTDSYSGSAEQVIGNITVNQKIVIASNTTVTFIPWQTNDENASDIASQLGLNTGDVLKKFDPTTGAYSKGWVVDPLLPSQSDFMVKKGNMIRIELVNQTSKTNGITAVVSTTSSSDYSVEIPLNYTYDSTSKSGNPGYNYIAWVSEKVITADQLATYTEQVYKTHHLISIFILVM